MNLNPSVCGGFSEQVGSPVKIPKGDTSNRGRGVRQEVNVAQSKVGPAPVLVPRSKRARRAQKIVVKTQDPQ